MMRKFTQFEYEFKIEGSMPYRANSRPTPFALRNQASEHIQTILKEGIFEERTLHILTQPLSQFAREKQFLFFQMLEESTIRRLHTARKLSQCTSSCKTSMVPNILRVWTFAVIFYGYYLSNLLGNRRHLDLKAMCINLKQILMASRPVQQHSSELQKRFWEIVT